MVALGWVWWWPVKQAVTKSESRLLESADEIKFCIYWPVGRCITYFTMWSFGGQPEQRPNVSHSLPRRVRGEKPTILTDERGAGAQMVSL